MGYRIQYGCSVIKEPLNEQALTHKGFLLTIVMLSVCCAIVFTVIRYRDMLWNWMLPGDPEVTREALSIFSENIRRGVPVGEAVEVFCKEILSGGIY